MKPPADLLTSFNYLEKPATHVKGTFMEEGICCTEVLRVHRFVVLGKDICVTSLPAKLFIELKPFPS